ncbi:MAG TPA: hypothetical protein VKG22_02495 [Stellaceae bacterium]|nr:hypothetical protein [Stellaceae bacterium]HMD65504.1 hypothetical protein [Stellaceae bacterium]
MLVHRLDPVGQVPHGRLSPGWLGRDDRQETRLEQTAEEIRKETGTKATAVPGDISIEAGCTAARAVGSRLGERRCGRWVTSSGRVDEPSSRRRVIIALDTMSARRPPSGVPRLIG